MAHLDGVFRREWGAAVAAIARWCGDLTVAEDAVQDACAEAVRVWPRDGEPDAPGAWLVTVARNRARDRLRRESLRPGKELAAVLDDIIARTEGPAVPHRIRDDELRMMFTCAHPALDRPSQFALTLRLVSGLTVPEIARALLHNETAVAARITRAKAKIRHANIPLRIPPSQLLPERTPHVLSCVYSVFTEGTGPPPGRRRCVTNSATRAYDWRASCAHSAHTTRRSLRSMLLFCSRIRGAAPGWTATARCYRSRNRTAGAGIAP